MKNILKEKILIVDSNIDYAKFFQKLLKDSGYLSYIASSYDEAIVIIYDKIPDCILVDYMLPNSGAIRLSEHIKKDNMLKNIVVIFLTTTYSKNFCLKAFEYGADGFFLKSIDTDIFLSKIKAYIRLKRTIESNLMYMTMLKQDMEYASKLQKNILSYGNTSIPKNDISIYHYAPNEISGDYIGIKVINDGWYAIIVVDVLGHGIASSMATILIKSFFDSNAVIDNKNTLPSCFIMKLNNFFLENNFDKNLFLSIFYAIYDNNNGKLICSSGGAPKPLYYSNLNENIKEIKVEGPLVGIMENSKYYDTSITINHNDLLFVFTDGAYEIFNTKGKMLGEDKLKEIFFKYIDNNINVIKDNIIKELKSFSNNNIYDDISIIILRRTN